MNNWADYERGGRAYAREEIVAELVSYKIAKRLGVPNVPVGDKTSRGYVGRMADNAYARSGRRRGRGADAYRTREDASALMRDVDAAVDVIMSERGLARARPQLGGGG